MYRRQWLADLMARRAVERDFMIIGEAIKRIRDHHPVLAERIPELPKITGFRDKSPKTIEEMANLFIVSKQSMDIRLDNSIFHDYKY